MKRFALLFALWLPLAAPAAPPPTESVYRLPVQLTDQAGHAWPLGARRGRVQLVSMFYTSCTMVCPLIIDGMAATVRALDPPARAKLDLLAITFDPARDDVTRLREYAKLRRLAAPPWTLARAEPGDTRRLSAVLGVSYRADGEGDFNHTSELILLGVDGRILARTSTLGRTDPEFVRTVRKALAVD